MPAVARMVAARGERVGGRRCADRRRQLRRVERPPAPRCRRTDGRRDRHPGRRDHRRHAAPGVACRYRRQRDRHGTAGVGAASGHSDCCAAADGVCTALRAAGDPIPHRPPDCFHRLLLGCCGGCGTGNLSHGGASGGRSSHGHHSRADDRSGDRRRRCFLVERRGVSTGATSPSRNIAGYRDGRLLCGNGCPDKAGHRGPCRPWPGGAADGLGAAGARSGRTLRPATGTVRLPRRSVDGVAPSDSDHRSDHRGAFWSDRFRRDAESFCRRRLPGADRPDRNGWRCHCAGSPGCGRPGIPVICSHQTPGTSAGGTPASIPRRNGPAITAVQAA